ncbi:hypothetical protein RvY_02589 [Ramazzottius varieornatus]|uniref:Uncharacterized protein n=1 Tax=Ramazzottius varieornatus TaxID=947166 RepID=A0A1D1UNZ8_RAMVA|nr:hypothetical protein RvY_02589 [Ramazzottius varieornatus]
MERGWSKKPHLGRYSCARRVKHGRRTIIGSYFADQSLEILNVVIQQSTGTGCAGIVGDENGSWERRDISARTWGTIFEHLIEQERLLHPGKSLRIPTDCYFKME